MPLSDLLSPALVCLAAGALWTANDPFVGKWKVDPAASRLTDEMQVEAAGQNKYAFTFGPGQVDTVVADGTDQPAQQGTTLSVTAEGRRSWTVVRKDKGRTIIVAKWTLSADGRTLDDAYTAYQPDGAPVSTHYTYQRTAGGSGFVGVWDSVSGRPDPAIQLEIQPYEGHGLSFASPGLALALNLAFDGKDHLGANPAAPPGAAYSGRRVGQRNLEITGSLQGKTTGHRHIEVSRDLKTMTMTVQLADEKKPRQVLVFERA